MRRRILRAAATIRHRRALPASLANLLVAASGREPDRAAVPQETALGAALIAHAFLERNCAIGARNAQGHASLDLSQENLSALNRANPLRPAAERP